MVTFKRNKNIQLSIYIETVFDEDIPLNKNILVIDLFKYKITINIPNIVSPLLIKQSNGYVINLPKLYGLYYFEDVIFLYYGIQNYEWDLNGKYTSKIKIINLNWMQYDFISYTLLDREFNIVKYCDDLSDTNLNVNDNKFISLCDFVLNMPSTDKYIFNIKDFDDKDITASCVIERRIWNKGRNEFAWLKYIYEPLVRYTLAIIFSDEVGVGKLTYNGGMVQTGVDFAKGQDVESVFIAYCKDKQLTFIKEVL